MDVKRPSKAILAIQLCGRKTRTIHLVWLEGQVGISEKVMRDRDQLNIRGLLSFTKVNGFTAGSDNFIVDRVKRWFVYRSRRRGFNWRNWN